MEPGFFDDSQCQRSITRPEDGHRNLLGRRVLEDETISVRAIEPPALSNQQRGELADELKRYFAEVDAHRRHGSTEEAEEVLTEAIRSSRPGYRPHQ
jgi:hypothetical protein